MKINDIIAKGIEGAGPCVKMLDLKSFTPNGRELFDSSQPEKHASISKHFAAEKPHRTNWKRLDSMTDNNIDCSDELETTPEIFPHAHFREDLVPIPVEQQITPRFAADGLKGGKAQGSSNSQKRLVASMSRGSGIDIILNHLRSRTAEEANSPAFGLLHQCAFVGPRCLGR